MYSNTVSRLNIVLLGSTKVVEFVVFLYVAMVLGFIHYSRDSGDVHTKGLRSLVHTGKELLVSVLCESLYFLLEAVFLSFFVDCRVVFVLRSAVVVPGGSTET